MPVAVETRSYEDQQKIVDMTTSSTNSFLDAWSTLVEAVRNGDMKQVSKFYHVYPTISSKVMVIAPAGRQFCASKIDAWLVGD